MSKICAPIVLFTYNRLLTLKLTVQSLLSNSLASESDIYIFSDAPRSEKDVDAVEKVRKYISEIEGFKKITVIQSDSNKGLAKSIIAGVTDIINKYDKVIVLEDDLMLAPNFLYFMNSSLSFYQENKSIYSISGFMFDIDYPKNYSYDVFFTKRHCSWGWAMWKDRWNRIDWNVTDFNEFNSSTSQKKAFDEIGADLTLSLQRQQRGEINSWAIRCNYQQFKEQTYTVYPIKSKIDNLGFGDDATHTTQKFSKYKATLDTELKYDFNFPEEPFEDPIILRRFTRKYSKLTRLYYFVLNTLFK